MNEMLDVACWDSTVTLITPQAPTFWSELSCDLSSPPLDVLRISASRPWRLIPSTDSLRERLRAPGPIRMILVESVVDDRLSRQCIDFAVASQLFDVIAIISPARGQGYAHDYALRNLISAPYLLKWDDDFDAIEELPIHTILQLMQEHPSVNQVCFNKRRTVPRKPFWPDEWDAWQAALNGGATPNDLAKTSPSETHGKPVTFVKEERRFTLAGSSEPVILTIKDKWWFGPAIWRMAFVRQHWQFFPDNVHNFLNDKVLYRLIDPTWGGGPWPAGVPAASVEAHIGTYLWGGIGHAPMVRHTGKGDSHWKGEFAAYVERLRATHS